jgi:hypothetical protein
MTDLSAVVNTVALEELRESVGGDHEFFAELVDDFLADPPTQLASSRRALSSRADQVQRAAHALNGLGRRSRAGERASICQGHGGRSRRRPRGDRRGGRRADPRRGGTRRVLRVDLVPELAQRDAQLDLTRSAQEALTTALGRVAPTR